MQTFGGQRRIDVRDRVDARLDLQMPIVPHAGHKLGRGMRFLQLPRADAERQASPSTREIFEKAERVYLELADKVERLEKLARSVD